MNFILLISFLISTPNLYYLSLSLYTQHFIKFTRFTRYPVLPISLHPMNILELLQNKNYKNKAILEKLICHSTWLSKEMLFTKAEETMLDKTQEQWIKNAYNQYIKEKKPLEYILGYVKFLWYHFKVSPDTLIPRPETEYMIEAVNEYIQETWKKISLMDIWTWCGVLWLSVLLHNIWSIKEAYFTDLSKQALDIARENYMNYKDRIWWREPRFLEASLLNNPSLVAALSYNEYILVANLPYIPEQLFEENTDDTVKKREPKMAFVGGDDGLDLYREMFDQILELQAKSCKLQAEKKESQISYLDSPYPLHPTSSDTASDIIMFLEMMTRQVDILRQEYKKYFGFKEVKTFHFNIRIVQAKLI